MGPSSFRATTSLKRTSLAAAGLGICAVLAYATMPKWSLIVGWDESTAHDLLNVATFFIGSLLGLGAIMAAVEAYRLRDGARWQRTDVDPPSHNPR